VPSPATTGAVSEGDGIIKKALINCVEFSVCKMMHLMMCEPHMRAMMDNKRGFLCEAYNELTESLTFLETWGSTATLEAFEDNVDKVGNVVRFGTLWGVNTWNESPVPYDPWEEAASQWVRNEDEEDVEGGKGSEDAPPEGCEGVIFANDTSGASFGGELRSNGGITGYLVQNRRLPW
jgi:hypothetical protein